MLGALISLLTGCGRPAARQPAAPGVSIELRYPVLLAGGRELKVKDDQNALITTKGAAGINFLEMKILDSEGQLCEIRKATPFGQKSFLLDMGTGSFQVFLELKRLRKLDLQQAKALVMEVVQQPHGLVSGTENGLKVASERIHGCQTLTELLNACRTTWEWR